MRQVNEGARLAYRFRRVHSACRRPVYVPGEAYFAADQGKEAAAEFQKILDHRGIILKEPIGALAHGKS